MVPSRRSFIRGIAALAMIGPSIARAAIKREIVVDVSHQSGTCLSVEPLPASLERGSIITISDVNAWHRTRGMSADLGLRQFVVTVAAEAGHRIIHLYPSIVAETVASEVLYRTVDKLAMRGARVVVLPKRLPVFA